MKNLLRIALSAFALISSAACATPYVAYDIRGRVVDAETSQPLEGVIIVAEWELFEAGPGHGGTHGNMMNITEVVTDREGEFLVPGWGPRIAPPFTYLQDGQPVLLLFKTGYEPLEKYSEYSRGVGPATYESHSSLDGQTFKLSKQTMPLEEYSWRMSSFQGSLGWDDENYNWKAYPLMLMTLDAEASRLRESELDPNKVGLPDTLDSLHGGRRVVEDFLKGLNK